MNSELANENEGVLETLKQSNSKKVALQELLSIILNRQVSRKQAKLFLTHRFGVDKVDWLQMTHEEIYGLALAAKKYKLDNEERWRQEQLQLEREAQQRQLLKKEQQRLRLEMIRKNMTRQAMIKLVQESIERCEKIMLTCQDEQQYVRLKKSVDDLRRELFILQGKFFEQMDVKQLTQQDEDLDPQVLSQIKAIKEKKMQQIEHARQLRLKQQRMKEESIRKRLLSVRRRSDLVFHYYAKEMAVAHSETFEDRHRVSNTIDIKFFLKFVRQFELLSKRVSVYELTNIFKKTAINGLWLNADLFYQMIVAVYKKEQVTQEGKSSPFLEIQFIEYVNKNTLNRERLTEQFHLLDSNSHVHHYEFYTHSGLTKQDVMEEVHRRRALQLEKKRSTHNPKRGSTSFPILPHNIPVTQSSELKSPLKSPMKSPLTNLKASPKKGYLTQRKHSLQHSDRPAKNIYEQLKELEEKKGDRNLRKLFNAKTLEEDEFLRELRVGRKKSIV